MNQHSPAPAHEGWFLEQLVPLLLTFVVFGVFWLLLHAEIVALNAFGTGTESIRLTLLWPDVLVGMTIYLKTSIDFAIFIGHLMRTHPGWRNRIAIECGTAAGNALGTFIILLIWNEFRHIEWLLALMVFLAALVLLRLAEDGLEHAHDESGRYPRAFRHAVTFCERALGKVNAVTGIVLDRIMPDATLNVKKTYRWPALLFFSATIPFILGLDDFAGYVPLFSVVHVYGFAVGVLAGHLLLNICLFLSPDTTIRVVKQPIISFLGSLAFVGLSAWGFVEVWKILHGG